MTSEDGDDYMARYDHRRSIPAPLAPPSAVVKPKGGARLLSFFLRAVVMAVALALFFLFAGIAVLLLLLLCVVGRVLRRRRRFFHSMIRPMPEEKCGLTPDEMRCLPCFSYEVGTEAAEAIPTDCAVCLDGFGEGEWCRALPGCSHVFHAICVDRWLEKAAICPICRGSVAVDGDDLAAVPPLLSSLYARVLVALSKQLHLHTELNHTVDLDLTVIFRSLIYIELLNTVSASLLLMLASAARAAGGSASEAAAIAGGVVVAGSWLRSAIFAYSEVDLKVGMVVSVVEGCGGEKAVKRAGKLIEGRKMEGFGVMVGTMMVEGMIGKILGLGLGLGLGSAAGALEAMMGKFLTYFGYTAFYYECKRRSG